MGAVAMEAFLDGEEKVIMLDQTWSNEGTWRADVPIEVSAWIDDDQAVIWRRSGDSQLIDRVVQESVSYCKAGV